jgi:rare lipoprotein A
VFVLIKLLTVLLLLFSTSAIGATASWYGKPFHGRTTASGERYNMHALTAASNTLPFGTIVKVTNLKNKKSVKVRINDTGGFKKYGRAIDLSRAANRKINCGLCKVTIKVLK